MKEWGRPDKLSGMYRKVRVIQTHTHFFFLFFFYFLISRVDKYVRRWVLLFSFDLVSILIQLWSIFEAILKIRKK